MKLRNLIAVAFLLTVSASGFAQAIGLTARNVGGCYSDTISATGYTPIFINQPVTPITVSGSYTTTGSPSGVTIQFYGGNFNSTTAPVPLALGTSTTNTSGADLGNNPGQYAYWWVRLATLSGGSSPTVVVRTCIAKSTPLLSQLSLSGTSGGVPYFSNSSGGILSSSALTANSPVLGGGAGATPATVAGITSDGTSALTLGVAGSSVGSVGFKNATSGTITLSPVAGALGTVTLSLPAATDTLVGKATTDTLTNKTLTSPTLTTPALGAATGTSLTDTGDITTSTGKLISGTAGANVGNVQLLNATSGSVTIAPPTGALGTPTLTVPALTGSLATGYTCGTIAANGACANTALGGTAHWIAGIATLGSNTSTITGLSPAFTSSSSYFCVANDITTRANPVQAIPASASTVTFTNTTGASDNIQFFCAGN